MKKPDWISLWFAVGLLFLIGCTKSEHYMAPKRYCDVRPTWVVKEVVRKECVPSGKNGCASQRTVRSKRYEYEFNCKWKEFTSDKPSK